MAEPVSMMQASAGGGASLRCTIDGRAFLPRAALG
jgi:hypothetical protein